LSDDNDNGKPPDREPGEDDMPLENGTPVEPDPFEAIREEWWAAEAQKAKRKTNGHANGVNGHAAEVVELRAPILNAEAGALIDWLVPFPDSIPTGIPGLDHAIEGFHAETTYCLVGPTGRGKTGMALQMAQEAARHRPVVYFTSELSRRQVLSRVAAQRLKRAWIKLYRLEPEHATTMAYALKGLRLHVVEIGRETDLFATIAQVKAENGGEEPIVFLDYLQHAARRLPTDDIRMATATLMDKITDWARVSKSIAVVLSASGRAYNAEDGTRSAADYVSAGGETSVIEYNAGSVLFLQAELCQPGGTATARLHIAKARFLGAGVTVGLRFDGAYGSYESDPEAALTDIQREALDAIRKGAKTTAEVQEQLQCRRQQAQATVRVLVAQGLAAERPLRPLGGLA
jgi:hypothetical protein